MVSKGPSVDGGWWRAQEVMQCCSWGWHSLGRGFKEPFQWIVVLSCTSMGIFRQAPALMLCHRAGREKLPLGSGLRRQFYPPWAFIPIKRSTIEKWCCVWLAVLPC